MALSMDEQRMLAEIERRLAAEDPGLAARLSSFRRPGPAVKLRTTRGRIVGSLFTIALLAVVSLMVYAMVPFRAHGPKTTLTPQASNSASVSGPARLVPAAGASTAPKTSTAPNASASAKTSTSAKSTSAKTTTASKTTAGKTKTAARTSLSRYRGAAKPADKRISG